MNFYIMCPGGNYYYASTGDCWGAVAWFIGYLSFGLLMFYISYKFNYEGTIPKFVLGVGGIIIVLILVSTCGNLPPY